MKGLEFEQFKSSSDRGLSAYFDKHSQALLMFAYRIVADLEVAEEVVQDAYIKLWDSRQRIESELHLKSFLYQTTRNACIDHLRGAGGRIQAVAEEIDENLRQPNDDLLAHIIHVETLQLIYKEVKKLPFTQQQVFQLTFIDGFSTDEIAAQLHLTTNAVFIARSKGLSTLRRIFKGKDMLVYFVFVRLLGAWVSTET